MKLDYAYPRRIRVEMVPLIDTFFLLLAFFISSVLSMSAMGGLPIELPHLDHTAKLDPADLIVITVAHDGQLQLDGQPVGFTEVAAILKAHPHPSTLRVAVRADRRVPAGQLVTVLGAIRAADIARVGLVTELAPDQSSVPDAP